MRISAVPCALLALARVARAAVPADLVTNLPGFGAPLSKLYSGYVAAGANQFLHYVYSEAISADPSTAPLALWFNVRTHHTFHSHIVSRLASFEWYSPTHPLFSHAPAFSTGRARLLVDGGPALRERSVQGRAVLVARHALVQPLHVEQQDK